MDLIYSIIDFVKRWTKYFGLSNSQHYEDLFYQLLLDKNYDEALKLAQQHTFLDIDLVYKLKWRSSGVTVTSINSVLSSVKDKLWAINECVQTVPISYEACRTLIEHGLKEANLRLLYQLSYESLDERNSNDKHEGKLAKNCQRDQHDKSANKLPELPLDLADEDVEGMIDFENLNDKQISLCQSRQDLLRFEHSLFAYENILGDYRAVQQHFDHVFYDEFRQKCPLEACIDYAHDGDAHAVEIMLNFYTDDLSPHLLPIISNFPETLSPHQYRNLLPCLRERDIIYEWRSVGGQIRKEESDWSGRIEATSNLSINLMNVIETYEKKFYDEHNYLLKYRKQLTSDDLTQWFVKRALEMESRTLLLSNAIQLLRLGQELNINGLEKTHDDLDEFDRIMYENCSEEYLYLSLSEFNSKPLIDRLLLMTGDSVKTCKDKFRFFVIPYLHRRDAKLGFEGKANILQEYFHKLAHTSEHICRSIYTDLLDRIENDSFVADWTEGLDDLIDTIGEEIKTIERDRQAKQLSSMASQTFTLGDYNGCYEACEIIMKKGFKECWTLCCQLGMHKQFNDFEAKYKLLAFTLAYCDDPDGRLTAKILNYIIELRKRDERIQLAYLQLNM